MLRVTSELTVIEDHGRSSLESVPHVEIRNHWNQSNLVVLKVLDQEVTLLGSEVIAAVNNAMNTAKY